MSQRQLPFGYLAHINSSSPPLVLFPSSSSSSSTSTIATTIMPRPAASSTAPVPDCFRTRRCDCCEMLFAEALASEPRVTYPCGHVYCLSCATHAAAAAARGNLHVFCARCANLIVRKRDNFPCTHPIPAVSFNPHTEPSASAFTALFPDRYRLALGQKTGPRCQRCWLVAKLQNVTYQLKHRFPLGEYYFPGEIFACVQVDRGKIVHGLRNELPDVEVDVDEDVEMCRGPLRQELAQLAEEICGGLGQVPMEPNFDPRGDVVVQYRLRGFATWMRKKGGGERAMPTALRIAVYGADWV